MAGPFTEGLKLGTGSAQRKAGLEQQARQFDVQIGLRRDELKAREEQAKQAQDNQKFEQGMTLYNASVDAGMVPEASMKILQNNVAPFADDALNNILSNPSNFTPDTAKTLRKLNKQFFDKKIDMKTYYDSVKLLSTQNPMDADVIEREQELKVAREELGKEELATLQAEQDIKAVTKPEDEIVPPEIAASIGIPDGINLTFGQAAKLGFEVSDEGEGSLNANQVETDARGIVSQARQLAANKNEFGFTEGFDVPRFNEMLNILAEGAPQAVVDRIGAISESITSQLKDPDVVNAMGAIEKIRASSLSNADKERKVNQVKERLKKKRPDIEDVENTFFLDKE